MDACILHNYICMYIHTYVCMCVCAIYIWAPEMKDTSVYVAIAESCGDINFHPETVGSASIVFSAKGGERWA